MGMYRTEVGCFRFTTGISVHSCTHGNGGQTRAWLQLVIHTLEKLETYMAQYMHRYTSSHLYATRTNDGSSMCC